MRTRYRLLAALLVALTMWTGSVQATPAPCLDDCADDAPGGCADCPFCSPSRAPSLVGHAEVAAFDGTVTVYEPVPTVRLSRTEDRGVFHVPRLVL